MATPRPPELGPLEISITPRGRLDRETVQRFAALGVHRLIPAWTLPDEAALLARIERFGAETIAAG